MNNYKAVILFLALCLFASCVHAQSFTKSTIIELSAVAGTLATDGYTSPAARHELNPLLRPIDNTGGKAAYFSASFGAVVLANRLLRNHTKIRHVMNWSIIGVESYWSISNTHYNNCNNQWIIQGIHCK